MISTCPTCNNKHRVQTSAVTIGRFTDAPRYRATYDGSEIRRTKEQARRDYCEHWNEIHGDAGNSLNVHLQASFNAANGRFDYVALVLNGSTMLVAGVPQAFPIDSPAGDYDALTAAFNAAASVNVTRGPVAEIETAHGSLLIPVQTLEGKK